MKTDHYPLRVAIAGCGRMGRERARAAAELGATVTMVCDRDLARAQTFAEQCPGSEVVPISYLDLRSVDALFVCIPPVERGPLELASVASGTPFLVEKPIGLCAAQAEPLLNQLKFKPVINAVGYMNRYRNSVRHAAAVLKGRTILGLTCSWVGRRYKVPWWLEKQSSGGPFNEQGTHSVDLFRLLVGEIQAVNAVAASCEASAAGPELSVAASLRFRRGALGTVFYSCEAKEKDVGLRIFTPEGTIGLTGWDLLMSRNTIDGTMPPGEAQEIFLKETAAFFQAIRTSDQAHIACDLAEAYRTQATVDALQRALQDKKQILL
jgi:myo-inositol 2-dehydrogenase/D-chiro-inositol 1-dehydrogenase